MTESFNGGGTVITGYGNSFLFELLPFILKHRLSRGVKCEELDDCWLTEDSWYALMTGLFNGRGTDINVNYNLFLFEWLTLRLKHRGITRSRSLRTLIVPSSTFVVNTNTLETCHDERNMSLWWCCVPVIFFVNGHQKVRANFLARQMHLCLSFSTRNKTGYNIFVSISS